MRARGKGRVAKFVVLVALAIAGFGWVVMSLWNFLIPAIFNGPTVNFWQAVGLLILTRLLFSGFRPWHYRQHQQQWKKRWEEKMASLSPEERDRIRQLYEKRCGGGYWNRERTRTEQPQSQQTVNH